LSASGGFNVLRLGLEWSSIVLSSQFWVEEWKTYIMLQNL